MSTEESHDEQRPTLASDEALELLREKLTGYRTPEDKSRADAKSFMMSYGYLSKDSMRVLASHHALLGEKHETWLPAVLREIDGWNSVLPLKLSIDLAKAMRNPDEDLKDGAVKEARAAANYILENYEIRKREPQWRRS